MKSPTRKITIYGAAGVDADYEAIADHLDSLIEGSEVQTSSWIPGSDWTGTPFEPIYFACRFDVNAAAQLYGLILWDVRPKGLLFPERSMSSGLLSNQECNRMGLLPLPYSIKGPGDLLFSQKK